MKYKIPETRWDYSLETEAKRVLHSAHQIAVGFYELNNFLVLPFGSKTKETKETNVIFLPDLPYLSINNFWDRVKTINISHFPINAPAELLEEVSELLKSANLPKPDYDNAEALWRKNEKEIIESIYNVMSDSAGKIKKITVYPTVLGTGVSFNLPSSFPAEVFIYLREDQGLSALTEAILTSLTRRDVYMKLEGLWQESELLVDWLVHFSAVSDTLRKVGVKEDYMGTIKAVRVKQQSGLQRASEDFLKRLGISGERKGFEAKNGDILVDKKALRNLTPREYQILGSLVRNQGGVVSLEDLGDMLFKDDESYSLYAISKTIQRIREKLEENGVSGSYIQALRGRGYILK